MPVLSLTLGQDPINTAAHKIYSALDLAHEILLCYSGSQSMS